MAKFKVNENVMARWPGSNLWFEASIVDFNDIEYQVMFKDDAKSEYVLKYRDVKVSYCIMPFSVVYWWYIRVQYKTISQLFTTEPYEVISPH